MTDKLRELLEDVQTVYEGKGMIVHPNSFDRLRMEVIKLDNINKQQSEQFEKMKCCGNCKYSNQDGAYTIVCKVGGVDKTHYIEIDDNQVCDKWEIREK